jgi:hypothetical protein
MLKKDNPHEHVIVYVSTGNSHISEYKMKLCDAAFLCEMLDKDNLVVYYYVIWENGTQIPRSPDQLGFSDNYEKWIKHPDTVSKLFYGVV